MRPSRVTRRRGEKVVAETLTTYYSVSALSKYSTTDLQRDPAGPCLASGAGWVGERLLRIVLVTAGDRTGGPTTGAQANRLIWWALLLYTVGRMTLVCKWSDFGGH